MPEILVVGALHWDVIVRAPHLPAADETVQGEDVAYALGGKGANQALAARRHGAGVAMAGRIGDDAPGLRMREVLARAGVDTAQLQHGSGASGMSVAVVEAGGAYGAVIVSAANRDLDPAALVLPAGARLVLLQNEVPEAANLAAARAARAAGARVMLNAAPARQMAPELLELVDILIVNRVEAAALAPGAPEDAAAALAGAARTAIVTLGAEGLVLAGSGGPPRRVPALAVEARSTHGAGDAFAGALAARLAAGDALEAAAAYAQAAAALHVAAPEAAREGITPAAVRAAMAGG